MSLRDEILGFDDPFLALRPEIVPEWGNLTVYYRGWTGKERDAAEDVFGDLDDVDRGNLRGKFVARFLLDSDGRRIFSDADADKLGDKNAIVLDRLFKLISKFNEITKESVEDAKKN